MKQIIYKLQKEFFYYVNDQTQSGIIKFRAGKELKKRIEELNTGSLKG